MRGLLGSMASILDDRQWHTSAQSRVRLRQLVDELWTFDRESHRPKGVAMLEAMRGRSAAADRELTSMQQERERDDEMLANASALLDDIEAGVDAARNRCAEILMRYRQGMLLQMDNEETLLRAHAEELLTEDEWCRVVSTISSTLYPGASRH